MSTAGAVNAWECPLCGHFTVAVHVDEGVTPMMLRCQSAAGCNGMAVSLGYPKPPIPEFITDAIAWEWARPSTSQMKRWKRERDPMFEHCLFGGLVLRPRPGGVA